MTKEKLKKISELDDKIRDAESYVRDLQNERNKIILSEAARIIAADADAMFILKGELGHE